MKNCYTAFAYCNEEKIAAQDGDDIEILYAWMVLQANDYCGDVHGEIINNDTEEIVRTFNKTYLD